MANFMAWFGGERSVDSMWNRAGYHNWLRVVTWPEKYVQFTSWKNKQTVRYFLKTYDTYAFMAN